MLRKLLLSAAALGLSATVSGAAERTKFEFWTGLTGDLGGVVDQVCKRFNESQDKYEIVCTSQGSYDQALQNAIAAFRVKKAPSIVQIFDAGTLDLMLSGAYYPIGKLMADNNVSINWDDYIPAISAYFGTSKGVLNSLPFNNSTAMLYWNKAAFAKIGKTEAPKTWEEAFADMRALKAAGYECPLAWNNDTWQSMEQFAAAHGLPIASQNNGYGGLNAEITINKEPKFVNYVKDLKKAYDDGALKIKMPETGATIVQAFASGDCQMLMSSIADHGTVGKTAKPDMAWDVTPLPVYEGTKRHNTFVGGASLWVLNGRSSEEYKGAAAFLAFLAKPESALFWSTNTGYIPVTKSGFEFMKADGFYEKPQFKGREKAIASLTVGPIDDIKGIRLGGFVQIRKEFRDALTDVMSGKAEVQVALDAAAERSNAVLRKFEKTYAGQQLP
jgi:sn-glycerol 3-phosphate transport system substrate-binding protein